MDQSIWNHGSLKPLGVTMQSIILCFSDNVKVNICGTLKVVIKQGMGVLLERGLPEGSSGDMEYVSAWDHIPQPLHQEAGSSVYGRLSSPPGRMHDSYPPDVCIEFAALLPV